MSLYSPYKALRQQATLPAGDKFIEIWTKCSLETCIERDVKGLYKKALDGTISDMTGVQDPYEEPIKSEITVDTGHISIDISPQRYCIILLCATI